MKWASIVQKQPQRDPLAYKTQSLWRLCFLVPEVWNGWTTSFSVEAIGWLMSHDYSAAENKDFFVSFSQFEGNNWSTHQMLLAELFLSGTHLDQILKTKQNKTITEKRWPYNLFYQLEYELLIKQGRRGALIIS